jgi:hypothetical protein
MTCTTTSQTEERPALSARRRLNRLFYGADSSERIGEPRVTREYSEEELDALLAQLAGRVLALLSREAAEERLAA